MKEIINLRKPREKHFLNDDGTITLYAYDYDVHYRKDNHLEEIDNSLGENENCFFNKSNSLHFYLYKKNERKQLLKVLERDCSLEFFLEKMNLDTKLNFFNNKVTYENILENVDLEYFILDNKLKDVITIKSPTLKIGDLVFKIKTNLSLSLESDAIVARMKDEFVYLIEKPTLVDKQNKAYDITYQLEEKDGFYYLSFNIDSALLLDESKYPLVIDPTITNTFTGSVFDTYIYPNDTGIDRNNTDILKVGVDSNNVVYRTLLQFDLPVIGTGCEVVDANVVLTSHSSNYVDLNSYYKKTPIYVHRITDFWAEWSDNWNTMHDKYDEKIESYFMANRSELEEALDGYTKKIHLNQTSFSIINLVKRWYAGVPNYGLLLKSSNETYDKECREFAFYSKNNTLINENIEDPKPYLILTYRNFNGLEDYMSYQAISHTDGMSYINYMTGNLTSVFDINKTIGGKSPINLSLIYNTNDVVLNYDYGVGIGFKFNYYQTLKEIQIENQDYLEYLDGDGTLHYFYKKDDSYLDEDGLNLTIKQENSKYVMTDKNGQKMIFTSFNKTYYLTEIIDDSSNQTIITYDGTKIVKIIDADKQMIKLTYSNNLITIESDFMVTNITLLNNQITQLKTKFGTTLFSYNANKLLDNIKDINGLQTHFTYYGMPYRIWKVLELGENGEEGNSLEYIYGFQVTKVRDLKGRVNTYTFNNQGNTTGITNLKDGDDFELGYGIHKEFETYNKQSKNQLLLTTGISKYTNNLFSNHSFEDESIKKYDKALVSHENARSGNCSLKILEDTKLALPKVLVAGVYTFSGYFKNSGSVNISLIDNNGKMVSDSKTILKSDDFKRWELTASLEVDTSYFVNILPEDLAVVYLDDVQFEKGEVANYINILENSNFEYGFDRWIRSTTDINGNSISSTDEIVTLDNGIKAYKRMNRYNVSASLAQIIPYKGKKNETYQLSFWYKNEGIIDDDGDYTGNLVYINFDYLEELAGEPYIYHLNIHGTEWQYFQMTFTSRADYQKVSLDFTSQGEVNALYLTNITLTKDLENNSFSYDERGNLKSSTDQTNGTSNFQYDMNNQLIGMFNPMGNHFMFEYDNQNSTKLLAGISKRGIENRIEYDEEENPIKTVIRHVKFTDGFANKKFYIRKKGTNLYLFSNYDSNVTLKKPSCHIDTFTLEQVGDNFYLCTTVIPRYLKISENLTLKLEENKNEASSFSLLENKNGSYSFLIVGTDNCLTFSNDVFALQAYDENLETQQFYLENAMDSSYIESLAEYTEDGKFIKKTIDSLGKETVYDIDKKTGLTKSIKNPKGNVINYDYNEMEQLTKVTKNNKSINYSYNTANLLEDISCINKKYHFDYDAFLNVKRVSINNQTLITNVYEENNGNLVSANYGNGSDIKYTYDELERLKALIKNNKTYRYLYNNMNDLVKIEALNEQYQYYYDFAKRLSSYMFNKNRIDYDYDVNSNITDKQFSFGSINKNIHYEYDEDDSIVKVVLNDGTLNYQYDSLGRLTTKDINKNLKVSYEYFQRGEKTSFLLKRMIMNEEVYEYVYDDLYNITHIYKNGCLLHHYRYDVYNQLIKEENYLLDKEYSFQYDESGNLLKKQEYLINTSSLIKEDVYQYGNENWKDQLTKFNNTSISYDAIGNPTRIGSVALSYNIRELQRYCDDDLDVFYTYDKDGIRIKKEVNGEVFEYFTENSDILFEKRGNHVLYYMRDDNGRLLGFTYDNQIYYYKKNIQEDIIGIYNSDYDLVASYLYDAWGKIEKIIDSSGNIITDLNHIAYINPFRYRSYYYDEETGLYYLNSRYYNPSWGRFINADSIIGTAGDNAGYNLYVYCNNEPVRSIDSLGSVALAIAGTAVAIGADAAIKSFVGAVVSVVVATISVIITATAVKAAANAAIKPDRLKGNHNVYLLTDPNQDNKVEYVGRTTNPKARAAQHDLNPYKRGLEMQVIFIDLSYEVARGIEESMIVQYQTINKGNYRNNQIHGINMKRIDKYTKYMNAMHDYLGDETYVGGIEW